MPNLQARQQGPMLVRAEEGRCRFVMMGPTVPVVPFPAPQVVQLANVPAVRLYGYTLMLCK